MMKMNADNEIRLRIIVAAAAEAVAVNTAAALYVSDRAGTLAEGLELARETLHSGAGLDILETLGKKSMEISESV